MTNEPQHSSDTPSSDAPALTRRERRLREQQLAAAANQTDQPAMPENDSLPAAQPHRPADESEQGAAGAPTRAATSFDAATGSDASDEVNKSSLVAGWNEANFDSQSAAVPSEFGESAASQPADERPATGNVGSAPGSRRGLPQPDELTDLLSAAFDDDPNHGSRRKGRGCLAGIVVLVLIAAIAIIAWTMFGDRIAALFGVKQDYSGEGNGTTVEFLVTEGETGTDIGQHLEEQGVVKSADVFVEEVLSRADEPQFHPGTYELQEQMSAKAALDRLLDPNAKVATMVTIAEGLKAEEIYPLIEENTGVSAEELKQAASDPQAFGLPPEATSVEGFLFPATYNFEPGTDATTIIKTMVDRTYQSFAEIGVPEDKIWDVIRMASLIEKEVFDSEDRYKVSRVFYNRINIGMPLQSDATILYWTEDFNLEDASNPYNTYIHPGLMPGPISNPGDESIEAALNPVDGDWLYFVTVNFDTGETVFSVSYEDHLKAVEQWRAWMKEHPEYQE